MYFTAELEESSLISNVNFRVKDCVLAKNSQELKNTLAKMSKFTDNPQIYTVLFQTKIFNQATYQETLPVRILSHVFPDFLLVMKGT